MVKRELSESNFLEQHLDAIYTLVSAAIMPHLLLLRMPTRLSAHLLKRGSSALLV